MFGLVGYPLGGSFSSAWFGARGVDYRNFELPSIDLLPALLASEPSLVGFNVTSPYKESVIAYLDELDPVAAAVGAVNCVVRARTGRLSGSNTDAPALRDIFSEMFNEVVTPPKALILGTGGAAKAAAWALGELGVEYKMVSRTAGDMTYGELAPAIIADHRLIVNATPVGSYALAGARPDIPYGALTPEHTLFDMIYNPAETLFLRAGRERGAQTFNGLAMLERQAELSCKVWGL
jgi:shikimate dehydrogenase